VERARRRRNGRAGAGLKKSVGEARTKLGRNATTCLVDSGYTGQPFADTIMERLKATVQVAKRNELRKRDFLAAFPDFG